MNNKNGKYGIWLTKLFAWAQTSSGLIYRYDDLDMLKRHIESYWYEHGAQIKIIESKV